MFKKIILIILLSFVALNNAYATDSKGLNYTKLTVVDLNTFNEYRYKITEQFLDLRDKFSITGKIDKNIVTNIKSLAEKGYNYLPDNLTNKNLLSKLKTALAKGVKYPDSDAVYSEITTEILNYIEKISINKVTGTINAYPDNGNAPLTVTFRAKVTDPSGSKIPTYNYTWWIDEGGKRKVISNGKGPSLNYTFKEEGTFTIFLDVTSDHKNARGYTDVLPFRSSVDVKVNEKIASLIIKVNSESLREKEEIKFNPDEARYGLIFDATSSTPTGGSKFTQTEWDFGNGVKRKYTGAPKIERVIYNKEGEFTVKLKLRTNEGKTVEREFVVIIHDPIATIKTDQEEGYLGDKFTFTAQSGINDDDLTYAWEIIDIKNDKSIFKKNGKTFTYAFLEKGQYNVVLRVTEPSSNIPDIDTMIIYINSRAPVASFITSIPFTNKPNTVLLDGSKSYDPDISDDGNLKFSWLIDGERVNLENPNYNGSIGYYTFDSIGNHSVILEVKDSDDITIQEKKEVSINSILSVDFSILPRVAQREQTIKFIASSNEARVFNWEFGDGTKDSGKETSVQHKYSKSGVYKVKLTVVDKDDNKNTYIRDVYVGESDSPLAFIKLYKDASNEVPFKEGECDGKGAYIVNRVDTIKVSGEESINIDGLNTGLTYSWKFNNDKLYSSRTFDKKFDELGCFPLKLVVKSDNNGKTSSKDTFIKVDNEAPTLSSLNITVKDETTDPVIVNIQAYGAKDNDGIIQSYLWYYYTDVDPEPQDFRATREPSTNFVLPKITGNYYFAVVMKDNNEVRVNSEQITDSKYFITLSGDNINTPILDLSVNNTSISIGEELILTAKVKNILDQDITNKVEFSWDLDGDGFYEKNTNKAIIEHKYEISGEFHPKVKAKYKGYSATKNITVSVANILKPEFSYISIGNEFAFLDESLGTVDSIKWDLGDKTIISDKKYFVYTYTDNLPSHNVKLTLREGTKTKTIEQKVVKNVKNYLKVNKGGLIIFSVPEIIEDKIKLEESKKIYVYLKDDSENLQNYVVDYDISYDSDLNGGKDDDEDNKNDSSYTNGSPILITLNDLKTQTVRLMTKDSSGKVINSYDFTIEKSYVEEKEIDLNTLKFEGVSENDKLKIEQLKDYIQNLSKEHKLKALMFVQKLQEEWFDNREKTNVILEFEAFINETGDPKAEEIMDLLESFLVTNGDTDEKSISFNALKNLIPTTISCGSEEKTGTGKTQDSKNTACYDSLVLKLEKIKNSNDVEENRKIGAEILSVIEKDTIMTNKEKVDFKAILKTLVYGGLKNIPEEEVKEVINEEPKEGGSNLLSLFLTVLKWLGIIIGIFCIIVGLYYVYFLITNKDKNVGFQDFIIDITSPKDKKIENVSNSGNGDMKDILGELDEDEDEIKTNKQESISEVKQEGQNIVNNTEEVKQEIKQEPKEEISNSSKDIPDWLKGSFEQPKEEKTEEPKQEEIQEEPKEEEKEENNDWKLPSNEELEEITKVKDEEIKEEDNIPDWLKGSFEQPKEEEKTEEIKEEEVKEEIEENIEEPKEEKSTSEEVSIPEEKTEEKEEDNIPDWLKGSFEQPKEEEKTEEIKEEDEEKVEKEQEEEKEEKPKKSPTKKKKKKPIKVKEEVEVKTKEKSKDETKQDETEEETKDKKTNGDLWDDGMKIPDWLKTDDEK